MIKVEEYIRNNRMIEPGDVVLAGVSGGADSICLLFLLQGLKEKLSFKLMVAHVNHGIREDAKEDAAYVKKVCDELSIPFYVCKADIPKLSEEWKMSEEETGRKVRYEFFESVLKSEAPEAYEAGKVKIAVAHQAEDRAETFLLNLFRGTGLKGLASIQPVRGKIIRPLLFMSRQDIEKYLEDKNIEFRKDSTNDEDDYLRNRIRNHVLPYVKREISSSVIDRINFTADIATEAERYIDGQVRNAYYTCITNKNDVSITVDTNLLTREDPYIQNKLILLILSELSGGGKDIGGVHVRAVRTLLKTEGSHEIDLPYRIKARKIYDTLTFGVEGKTVLREREAVVFSKDLEREVTIKGYGKLKFKSFLCDDEKLSSIPRNQYTKWFDYDKIGESLTVRNRNQGDYLIINNFGQRKSLQDYMVDEKIPRNERDSIPVLADGNHILWVLGYRVSAGFKVDNKTRRILQVELEEENYD